jgi:hypothetical protein
MKRSFMTLLTIAGAASALGVGALVAQADAHGRPDHHHHRGAYAYVIGKVTTGPTVANPDQFTATAKVRGTKQTATTVTITTNSGTKFDVNGDRKAALSAIAPGDKFTAKFAGSKSDTLATLTASPALAVVDRTPKEFYGFLGKVTAIDSTSTPATVTVDVTRSAPKGLFTGTDTFEVKSLKKIVVGDVVSGGIVAAPGTSAATIESEPIPVLINHGHHHGWRSKAAWHKYESQASSKAEAYWDKRHR